MKRARVPGIALVLIAASSSAARSAAASVGAEVPLQAPFETLLPWSLPAGEIEIAGGVAFRSGARPPFFSGEPGAARDEWRLDLVDAAAGAGGGAEARLQFGLLSVRDERGEQAAGVQDARLTFAFQLPPRRPELAVAAAVKLPNASGEERLGTDETDVALLASAGARSKRGGWAASAGLRILGSPREAGVQDDLLALGAAGWMSLGSGDESGADLTLFGEVTGQAASRFGNDDRFARAGLIVTRGAAVALSVRCGLTSASEDWGVEARVGVTVGPRRGGP